MSDLTREQVEAMDECAEWSARSHPLPHPQASTTREPIPTLPFAQPFAPGVIEGPFTQDAQEHHDWEDQQRGPSEGWGRIGVGLGLLIAFRVVMAAWGAITQRFGIDWTGVARLFGAKH